MQEARDQGFGTAVVLDPSGNVAEFAYTNLYFSVVGRLGNPTPNGTFLNGITRQRVIQLLRAAGAELADADELFSTANYSNIMPCTRLDGRELPPGPMFERARTLYMAYAETC